MLYRNKKKPIRKTDLKVQNQYEGEPIEDKVSRIVNNKEPISEGADIIYTDRADGVQAAYNIRTDRMEVALDAMTYVSKDRIAKREQRAKARQDEKDKKDGKPESIGGTGGEGTAPITQ